jgi:DNA-binding FadR family transcriptional regulator
MLLAQRIVSEISDRHLSPGTPLPAERSMLETYGVARGTLREALRFLEIQGVITMKTGPGGGPTVGEPSSRNFASTIAMVLQLENAAFREVVEARVVLEPPMAAQAAVRITDDELELLHQSVRDMRDHLDDLDFFLHENENFHDLIGKASRNGFFALIISSLNWIIDGSPLGVDYPVETRRAVLTEHQRIYRAIADRDPARAAAAMSVHIRDYAAYLERYYPQLLDARLRWEQVG